MKKIEKIVDISTGEEQILERDETAEELEKRQLIENAAKELEKKTEEQLIAKLALLKRLGITEEESQLLLS